MAKRPSSCRFIIPDADTMRASIPATQTALAGASNCSSATTKFVLTGVPRTKNVCEKIISGLKKLGHPTASNADIKEV